MKGTPVIIARNKKERKKEQAQLDYVPVPRFGQSPLRKILEQKENKLLSVLFCYGISSWARETWTRMNNLRIQNHRADHCGYTREVNVRI